MNTPQRKLIGGMLVLTVSCLVAALSGHAQSTRPASPVAAPAPPAKQTPMSAEQVAVWNSPNMLRARAWLQEYCATSKNCKPGDAEVYMAELEHMSPTQMKLWLMKFDEEEDQKKQQRAFYQQAQATVLKQAKSTDRATQKSYGEIESEETASANQAQSQIEEQEQNEQQNQDDKQMGPYTPYGQGYYPGGGGVHYHFHVYPY
jgi:hypothetical protein